MFHSLSCHYTRISLAGPEILPQNMDFELTTFNMEMEENIQENLNLKNIKWGFTIYMASILSPAAKSTPLQGVTSSTGLSGEVLHSIIMAPGKTQWLLMGYSKAVHDQHWTAQLSNAFKMTNTSERPWEERTD
jgi:hypothetical protein